MTVSEKAAVERQEEQEVRVAMHGGFVVENPAAHVVLVDRSRPSLSANGKFIEFDMVAPLIMLAGS